MPLEFHSDAEHEMWEAALRYESERQGLGDEFLDAVRTAAQRAASNPENCSIEQARPQKRTIRSVPVNRFPFQIYFLATSDRIEIISVAHERRRPRYWRNRL
jgi:toxin ParE1/3/4